jgi:hypothetical protein
MTNRTHRHLLGVAAAAITLGTAGLATVASSADAASHDTGRVAASAKKFTFETAATELHGKASTQVGLFHGAINAGGKDVPHAHSDRAKLPGGAITVKHPDSQSTFVPKVNAKTCYATFTIKGAFTLTHGTGRYHGITGSGTYVGHGVGYLARTKKGTCDMRSEPEVETFHVVGTGTLR